jgi:hypothetical protein
MKTPLSQQSRKGFLFSACMCLFLYCLVEFSSLLGLAALKYFRHIEYHPILTRSLSRDHQKTLRDIISGNTTYLLHSPTLGWTIKPNGCWDALYRANSQGIRADKDYQPIPRSDVVRIATFGDSFTHGEEVKNEDTWQEQLIKLCPQLEVINFGVGGFGLDQSFLRYKNEGILYHPQIVLMGFMPENINRSVNVFRPFYTAGIPLTKPRFILKNDDLILLPNPLKDLPACKELLNNPAALLSQFGENDFHFNARAKASFFDFSPSVRIIKLIYQTLYERYCDKSIYKKGYLNPKSEAFVITRKLFDEFYAEVQRNNSLPIIVLFPCREDIHRHIKNKTKVYTPLIDYFVSQHYRFIDLLDAFEKYAQSVPVKDLFMQDHYSPLGNSIVSRFILDYIKEHGFTEKQLINIAIDQHQRSRKP